VLVVVGCSGGGGDVSVDVPDVVQADAGEPSDANGDFDAEVFEWDWSPWIEQGKILLASGESLAAYDVFVQVLAEEPEQTEALYGACLAETQMWVGFLNSVLGAAGEDGDPDALRKSLRKDASGSPVYENGLVGEVFTNIRIQMEEQQARLEILKGQGELVFELDAFSLDLLGERPMVLSGEWDRADVYSLSAMAKIFYGVFVVLESWNWDADLDTLEDAFDDIGNPGRAVGGLLAACPELLTLRDEAHAGDAWSLARESMRLGAQDFLEAHRLMAEETDDQGDDVARLGSVGDTEVLVLQGIFAGDLEELSLLWHGDAVSLRDSMTRLAEHLDGDVAQRVRLGKDLLVSLGLYVDVLHRTVGLTELLGTLGLDLPDAVGGLLGMLDRESPDAVIKLLPTVLTLVGVSADEIELDVYSFLDQPVALRDVLPAMGTNPLTGESGFLRSFECVRVGFRDEAWTLGEPLRVLVHDPLSEVEPELVFTVAGVELTAALEPIEGIQGLLSAELETSSEVDLVEVRYRRAALEATLERTPGGDAAIFAMDASCEASLSWDGRHFFESEFSEAQELVDGDWEALAERETDGVVLENGYLALGSPSFGSLLWLMGPDGMAEANQDSINQFMAAVMAGIAQF